MVNQAAFAWAERINTDITNISIETVNAATIIGMITGSVPRNSLETSLGNCRRNLKETVDIMEETVNSEAPIDTDIYRELTDNHARLTARTESLEKEHRKPVKRWGSKYWRTLKLQSEARDVEDDTDILRRKAQSSSEFAKIARRKKQFGIATEQTDTWSICSRPNSSRVSVVPDLHSVSEDGTHDEEVASIISSELVEHPDDQENIPMHDIRHERASVEDSRNTGQQGLGPNDQAVSSSGPGGSANNDGGVQTADQEDVHGKGVPIAGSSRPFNAQPDPPAITT